MTELNLHTKRPSKAVRSNSHTGLLAKQLGKTGSSDGHKMVLSGKN